MWLKKKVITNYNLSKVEESIALSKARAKVEQDWAELNRQAKDKLKAEEGLNFSPFSQTISLGIAQGGTGSSKEKDPLFSLLGLADRRLVEMPAQKMQEPTAQEAQIVVESMYQTMFNKSLARPILKSKDRVQVQGLQNGVNKCFSIEPQLKEDKVLICKNGKLVEKHLYKTNGNSINFISAPELTDILTAEGELETKEDQSARIARNRAESLKRKTERFKINEEASRKREALNHRRLEMYQAQNIEAEALKTAARSQGLGKINIHLEVKKLEKEGLTFDYYEAFKSLFNDGGKKA